MIMIAAFTFFSILGRYFQTLDHRQEPGSIMICLSIRRLKILTLFRSLLSYVFFGVSALLRSLLKFNHGFVFQKDRKFLTQNQSRSSFYYQNVVFSSSSGFLDTHKKIITKLAKVFHMLVFPIFSFLFVSVELMIRRHFPST